MGNYSRAFISGNSAGKTMLAYRQILTQLAMSKYIDEIFPVEWDCTCGKGVCANCRKYHTNPS